MKVKLSFILSRFDLLPYTCTAVTTVRCCDCSGCQQWTSRPNTNFADGQANAARTVQACQTACFGNTGCVGFDWVTAATVGYQCWLTGSWSGRQLSTQGVTHYFLDRNCPGKLRHFNAYCNSARRFVRACIVFSQGRINHCAGCTMGGGPRRQGAPDQLPNFYHAVLAF